MKNKVSNYSRRNFLAGSATIAGLAAASAVLPASIAQANHADPKSKVCQILQNGKKDLR